MCRYGTTEYRSHFVCVPCRQVRKEWQHHTPNCTLCGTAMIDAGRDFHTPRRSDDRQWRKLALLFADGTSFDSCGCSGPGHVPHQLTDVQAAFTARERREGQQDPIRRSRQIQLTRKWGHTPLFGNRQRGAARELIR